MSADDFQTKYASVMESMLKSAVAETTKLFETMVDELKAEISRIKKENEDLKTRCSQFENAKSRPPVYTRESEPFPGTSDGFEKRDTAVQCDLVPFRTMLVEQCQPLRDSSLQNQEQLWCYEEMEYGLQEHNYVTHKEADSQMAYVQVKQEDDVDSSLQSVLKQEEDELTVASGQVVSDKAGSPWVSACGMENEGPHITQECSIGEIPLPQKDEETPVALDLPCLGMDSNLQRVQALSCEPEQSLVISLAAIKDGIEEESETSLKISEIGTQAELITADKHPLVVAPTDAQSEVEPFQKELTEPTPRKKEAANEEMKTGIAEGEASSQPVRRRRGRPPKRAKHLQHPVTDVLQSSSTNVTTEQELVTSPLIRVETSSSGFDTVNTTASERPKASPVKSKKTSSIITPSVQEGVNSDLEDVDNRKVGSLPGSVVALGRRCSTEKEKPSESQQLLAKMEEAAIQAPSNKVSSSTETLDTPPAELPQAPSLQPRKRCTSVTLQDAMLLVEAMNQSTVENASSFPQRMAAPPQTQCAPFVGTLQTVGEIPAEPQMPPPPVVAHEIAGKLPMSELSTPKQSTVETLNVAPKTRDAAPNSEAQAHHTVVTPNQQHVVTSSSTTTLPVPLSSAATQTSVGSLQQQTLHRLITSVAPNKQSNAAPQKIIVVPRASSSLTPHKIAALSPDQLPAVVSTVVAAQNRSLLSTSTAASLPLGTPSIPSVLQKTIYVTSKKLLPVVPSQSSGTSRDQQSGTPPHPKITIIIPRQSQSQTIVLTRQQDSSKSAAPVMVASPQLSSSSQELRVSLDEQTTSEKVATLSSQKRDNTSENLVSAQETTSVLKKTNALTDTCSGLKTNQQPTVEQKHSAMVRLTRLPFPVSTKESVLVSRLFSNGSSKTQSMLKENTTQKKSLSVVILTQPSDMPVVSTDSCPNLKETSVAESEQPNYVQEKASAPLEESQDSRYQPFTSSKMSAPDFEKSAVAIRTSEPLADELTSYLDEEIICNEVQNCALPNDPTVEEKQSAAPIQLTAITSKDTSDPHLQMTKTQFLAQLAVSPIVQSTEKVSDNDFAEKQKNSLVARLRSHLKTHLQGRRAESNPQPCKETETSTGSPKKLRLENACPNDKSTSEPISISPENGVAVEDVTSINATTNDPTPISPVRSGLCTDDVRSKSIGEQTTVSSRRSKATSEFTPVNVRTTSGRDGVGSKNKSSSSVSPKRTGICSDGTSPKNTKSTSVSPNRTSICSDDISPKNTIPTCESSKRTSTSRDSASPKNTKSTCVSPERTNMSRDGTSPKNTESTCVSPRRTSTVRDGTSPKNTKSTCMNPQRTSTSRDGTSPKNTKSTCVSSKTTSTTRDGTSPKNTKFTCVSPKGTSSNGSSPKRTRSTSVTPRMPKITSECIFGSHRRSNITKVGPSTKQIKRESSSFSPRRYSVSTQSAVAKKAKSETASPSGRWPRLAKDGVSPKRTGETTPAKKPRLSQDGTSLKKNLRLVNAKKLAEAAKAKTIAKMKISDRELQNGAKTSQLTENQTNCDTVKKCKTKAIWIPPRMPVTKTPKKETRSLDHTAIYPPSVSLPPIPVKAPPIVSPLQPLSVIGGRLLKNQCGECGRILSSSAALESHVGLHTGRRPFSCTLCGKSFPDPKGLKRHGRVHRNGRIHVCPQCGKGFVYRFGLTKHLQMVHGRLKPFVCQICNKGFYAKRDVEAHIRIHTGEKPFHCNLCEKKFTRRVELNVHLRWHNGEKRHWCPYCGKGFLDFNNLKRHKYIHTGEKPHSCPHCSKHFTQSGHLKKHVKNVHKVE